MIIENTMIAGWEPALRGMRNPMDSWSRSDSDFSHKMFADGHEEVGCGIGPNDMNLAQRLIKSGDEHRKFLRMIVVWTDITAPLLWWKEYDTYKVGTVGNSCSTMHRITSKPITLGSFDMTNANLDLALDLPNSGSVTSVHEGWEKVIHTCEALRARYNTTKNMAYWYELIRILPESYIQKRTVMLNYEVLRKMYHQRKAHKLTLWRKNFCEDWIGSLPYSEELITFCN